MPDVALVVWLGAGIGAAFMTGFYHLERHICVTHQAKMPRIARAAFYGAEDNRDNCVMRRV
jgi:hypothetical protein